AADEVVMVVADAGLVAGDRAHGLDASQQSRGGERAQDVVDGLVGDRSDAFAHPPEDRVRVRVRMLVHHAQHGEPLRGDPEVGVAQHALEVGEAGHIQKLYTFKFRCASPTAELIEKSGAGTVASAWTCEDRYDTNRPHCGEHATV